jgi:hypothetical protein
MQYYSGASGGGAARHKAIPCTTMTATASHGATHDRHSGLLSIHTTDFRVWSRGAAVPATVSGSSSNSSDGNSSAAASAAPSGDGGSSSYIVYTVEVAAAQQGDAPPPSTEKVHKRWSQIEQLHGELTHEFPALLAAGAAGETVAFPKQWRKTLEEREIERRLASLNEYFAQLLRRCEGARIKLSVGSVAFANFMADTDVPERSARRRRGPRLSRGQIEAVQKQVRRN